MPRSETRTNKAHEASRLKRLRALLGMSQRELAQEFKVAPAAVALWEVGARTIPGPALRIIELYEEELGMSFDDSDLEKGLQKLRTSPLSRGFRLSAMAAGVATKLAGASLQKILSSNEQASSIKKDAQVAIAKQLVERLGELKGFAMKVGQMMSYMDFAMPEAAREVLSSLQANTIPMSPSVIADILVKEFGKTPKQLFSEWTPVPLAAASLGQVHLATLHSGEKVAVKVQYPEISKSLEADLKNATVVDLLATALFRGQERGTFITELRDRFLEECDYLKEAESQETFRRLHAENKDVVVPRIFKELTTRRVLTSEFIQAQSFQAFNSTATQEKKNKAGEVLFDFAFRSIFNHGLFNGDPHPGNYLFRDGKVVFLDFGCIKRFTPEFLGDWKSIMRGILERDHKTVHRLIASTGIAPDPDRYDFDYHVKMTESLYEPWLHDANFTFTQDYVTRTWRMMAVDNPNKFKINCPKDWVFVNRLQWGLFAVLGTLQAESNWRNRLLPLLYSSNEKWPTPFPK